MEVMKLGGYVVYGEPMQNPEVIDELMDGDHMRKIPRVSSIREQVVVGPSGDTLHWTVL